jgi:hypothetical protein
VDWGVGVGGSCADANTRIKPDARMTQAIFIGASYALPMHIAQTQIDGVKSSITRITLMIRVFA